MNSLNYQQDFVNKATNTNKPELRQRAMLYGIE